MGKQVCFFATPSDLKQLFDDVFCGELWLLNQNGERIDFRNLYGCITNDFFGKSFGQSQCYLTKKGFKLSYNSYNRINQLESEVIQFNSCIQLPRRTVDMSSVYAKFTKDKFIVIDNVAEFECELAKCRENPTYIDNPNYIENAYKHGRFWYESFYYDDMGNKVYKTKELDKLYLMFQKHIRKNYILSEDKFAYIGLDAYQRYLSGNFVPCSGKNRVKFK